MNTLLAGNMAYCVLKSLFVDVLNQWYDNLDDSFCLRLFTLIFIIFSNDQNQRRIFGAILHVKQIVDDFKLAKIKNMRESKEFLLVKEIYKNVLAHLPNVIFWILQDSCSRHAIFTLFSFENSDNKLL
jgi:hypothetical protein